MIKPGLFYATVDASIMPDLVRAPINPAVIMVAERVAEFSRPAGNG